MNKLLATLKESDWGQTLLFGPHSVLGTSSCGTGRGTARMRYGVGSHLMSKKEREQLFSLLLRNKKEKKALWVKELERF